MSSLASAKRRDVLVGVELAAAWDSYLHHEHGKSSYFGVRSNDEGARAASD